eukprot:6483038-Amphidinium_carterae.1
MVRKAKYSSGTQGSEALRMQPLGLNGSSCLTQDQNWQANSTYFTIYSGSVQQKLWFHSGKLHPKHHC